VNGEDGHVYPDMDGITFSDCTVHYEDWNDYYYCELFANSQASYTHDHQMSRLTRVDAVDTAAMTVTVGTTTTAIPTTGRYNYVVVSGAEATENATCYHFVDGAVWNHEDAGIQTGVDENEDGQDDLVEDKQHIYLPFDQLVTGYGWGVTSKGLEDVKGVTVHGRNERGSVEKFNRNTSWLSNSKTFATGSTVKIGDLFTAKSNPAIPIDVDNVQVFVVPMNSNSTASGTYVANTTDWTQGTLTVEGLGNAYIYITDFNFCQRTYLQVELKTVAAKVTFDPNGGTMNETDRVAYAYSDFSIIDWDRVSQINIPAAPTAPEGYSFMGWYNVATGEKVYNGGETNVRPTGNMDLYAQWAKVLTVTFDVNGGNTAVDPIPVHYVASQNAYEQITLPAGGTKDGYTFGGWFNGSTNVPDNRFGEAGDEVTISEDMTLTACWMSDITISFNANGGDAVADMTSHYTHDAYSDISLPTPTYDGYRFMGWYCAEDGKTYAAGAAFNPVVANYANVTLTAQWAKLYKITAEIEKTTSLSIPKEAIEGETVTLKITYTGSQEEPPVAYTDGGEEVKLEGGKNSGLQTGYTYTFVMPADNITVTSKGSACVTGDTLVTMADGGKKMIQDVTEGENLLVWDFFNGKYAVVPAILVVNHGDGMNDLIKLTFSDGTVVKAINGHAFFDADLNEMALITAVNAESYVGHSFVKAEGDSYTTVELVDVEVSYEKTSSYSLVSAYHYNFIVEDMFSMTNSVHPMLEGLEVGEGMKYDLAADLETYGVYTYEDFADYIPSELFDAFNGPYLKISVEKGFITFDEILGLIDSYLK